MPTQTITTAQAVAIGIPRWMVLAMPEDVTQEVALAALMGRTNAQRKDALAYRLRELRRTQWERRPTRPTTAPRSLRPSKLAAITGYRTDSARHHNARMTVDAERRRAIAREGQQAWRDVISSGRS